MRCNEDCDTHLCCQCRCVTNYIRSSINHHINLRTYILYIICDPTWSPLSLSRDSPWSHMYDTCCKAAQRTCFRSCFSSFGSFLAEHSLTIPPPLRSDESLTLCQELLSETNRCAMHKSKWLSDNQRWQSENQGCQTVKAASGILWMRADSRCKIDRWSVRSFTGRSG